ncbi:MAG: Peroxiredoxin Bcp [Herbaspirillum frisingense]|uniref:thioredoxin-dependent peroxiredoxin n=1 Tax=Herbaspirillum frisingense TaxID=92645 RepID=A0A7V8FZJ7_9BURK|nr:MAG: Peroxiredoxin Bcp [Herbaspirillum frisingense]
MQTAFPVSTTRDLRRVAAASLLLGAALLAQPALAVLKPGEKAPEFSAPASLGGQVSTFSLSSALKKGPVVLYFYPAAFTAGCTIEAHLFAEATDRYKALGATVIGVSADSIETLNKFSVSECRSKFAVAADVDQKIMKSYDAVLNKNAERASRTSYVIAPDHSILYEYTDMNPEKHVENTMHALEQWSAKKKQ